MTWLDLFVFIVASIGIVYGITESVLFMFVRIPLATKSNFLKQLLYCAYCVGFWVGVGGALVFRHGEFNPLMGGFLVVGSIAILRGLLPNFLPGATQDERNLVEELRRDAVESESGRDRAGDAPDD